MWLLAFVLMFSVGFGNLSVQALFVFAGTRQNAGRKAALDLQLALREDDSGGGGGGGGEEPSGPPLPRPSEEGGAVVCRPPARGGPDDDH